MQSWPATAVPSLPLGVDPRQVSLRDSSDGGLRSVLPPGDQAGLYVCGITPYDATHLGHAATYLAFDTLVRLWRDCGLTVNYVQNVTDIDDPLLERALRDGEDWTVVAERETDLFRADMTWLRVLPPDHYVGAVEAMDEIARFVVALEEAGSAYRLPAADGDDVYFSLGAAPHFGQVSGYDAATMLALSAERGGDPERAGKKNPLDPLLWMSARAGEPSWDSPLGAGRPGWHVECAAIALNRLGRPFDVQGGGSDLVFPHHEMSAAHAEAATGSWPFARANVHAGMIGLDGEKMSKSRGNLVFVSRLREQDADPAAVRLALLAGHYRTDREWTDADLPAAVARLARWRTAVERPHGPDGTALLRALRAALGDDLDTPTALAAVDAWGAGEGDDPAAPGLVRDAVDALLGVVIG